MKVDSLTSHEVNQIASVCKLCAGSHSTDQCALVTESAQYVNNFQRPQQPVPATYHPNNKNYPNFSWSNNQNAIQPPYQQAVNKQYNPPGF